MVVRGWGGAVGAAVGAAAAAGAAQLGVGYGTGVISWQPPAGAPGDEAWFTALLWATWIAASSTVVGAVVADRLTTVAVGPDRGTRWLWRLVLSTAAALGAATTVLLVAVPSRVAEVAHISAPHTAAAGYTVLGVVAGLVLAVGALAARAVAANLLLFAGFLWLLAVATVVDGLVAGDDWTRVPMGFWDAGASGPWFRGILLTDAVVPAAAALLLGALAALPAARRGDRPVEVVLSGGAGPLLLAATYLLAQPDLGGLAASELSRHLLTPYLFFVGLLGSLVVAALPPRAATSGDSADADSGADQGSADAVDAPVSGGAAPTSAGSASAGSAGAGSAGAAGSGASTAGGVNGVDGRAAGQSAGHERPGGIDGVAPGDSSDPAVPYPRSDPD